MSDDALAWPEGLAHYVEYHNICLPEAFVTHALSNEPPTALPDGCKDRPIDLHYWIEWANQHSMLPRES